VRNAPTPRDLVGLPLVLARDAQDQHGPKKHGARRPWVHFVFFAVLLGGPFFFRFLSFLADFILVRFPHPFFVSSF
jgi:hypothetical protein